MMLFFLRLKDNNNAFVHFINQNYIVQNGLKGACIYDFKNAELVINENPDLEMINANKLLKNE